MFNKLFFFFKVKMSPQIAALVHLSCTLCTNKQALHCKFNYYSDLHICVHELL